jgi:hypothetical protein
LANRSINYFPRRKKVMKMKSVIRYLAAAVMAALTVGTAMPAALSASQAIVSEEKAEYISIRDMGFENISLSLVYVDNSTPDKYDAWIEIRNSENETLLKVDMSETRIDEATGLLKVTQAYFKKYIKPVIEGAE